VRVIVSVPQEVRWKALKIALKIWLWEFLGRVGERRIPQEVRWKALKIWLWEFLGRVGEHLKFPS
jgi:hypothetical protein